METKKYKPIRKKSKTHSILKNSKKYRQHSPRRRSKQSSIRKVSRKKSRRRSRRRSRKKSRRRRSNKKVTFNFSSDIPSKTLTIYGMNGCPACENSKQMCRDNNVEFKYYIRADHEDEVNKIAPGYKYVPVVVDENGKFIGGSIELEKYLKK